MKKLNQNPELKKAFEKAIKKGEVGPDGQTGIKKIHKKTYSHEVKILGKHGNKRLYGNKLLDGSFEWVKLGDHL